MFAKRVSLLKFKLNVVSRNKYRNLLKEQVSAVMYVSGEI